MVTEVLKERASAGATHFFSELLRAAQSNNKVMNFLKITPMPEGGIKSGDRVRHLLESTFFKVFMIIIACVNCIIAVCDIDSAIVKEYAMELSVCKIIVFAVFLWENLLKLYCNFWRFCKNIWNVFDIVATVIEIVAPYAHNIDERIVIILRVIRSARMFSYIEESYTMARIIRHSMVDLFNMYLLTGGCMLLFAVMGVQLFDDVASSAFGDIPAAMWTLFICLTQDGWIDILSNFKEADEGLMYVAMAFFSIFISIGAFILVNLKIAVIITNLQKSVEENESPIEDSDSTSTAHLEDVLNEGTIYRQTPRRRFCLDKLNEENLENLVLIKEALDKNMVAFQRVFGELERIIDKVSSLPENKKLAERLVIQSKAAAAVEENILSSEMFSGRAGDMLSTLMTLEEAHIIDTSVGSSQIYSRGMIREGVRRMSIVEVERRLSSSSVSVQDSQEG